MGNVVIKVEVGQEFPALKIRVTVDNLDDGSSVKYTDSRSFTHSFNLKEGNYMITVSGMNQSGDSSEIWISGDFIENRHAVADKPFFSKVFSGKV
jgi:hypothetical protein